jgi:hypothetical protein
MDVSELLESEFVSVQLVNDSMNKVATIVSPGVFDTDEYGKGCKLTVEFNGKQKFYKPNKTSLKNITAKWGVKTETWVGKQVQFNLALLQGGRKGIVAQPL